MQQLVGHHHTLLCGFIGSTLKPLWWLALSFLLGLLHTKVVVVQFQFSGCSAGCVYIFHTYVLYLAPLLQGTEVIDIAICFIYYYTFFYQSSYIYVKVCTGCIEDTSLTVKLTL